MSRGRLPFQTTRAHPTGRHARRGWSLIEMVAVVAIVATLTLTAVPAYRTFLLRAHRVEAKAALLALAAAQEKFYLQHNAYATELEASPPDGLGLQAVPANGHYEIAIVSADASMFTATATAIGGQARDADCASFGLDATGARTATRADCWSR